MDIHSKTNQKDKGKVVMMTFAINAPFAGSIDISSCWLYSIHQYKCIVMCVITMTAAKERLAATVEIQ